VPAVKPGFFPLDEQLQLGEHSWTPGTVKQMVKLGVEIPSYRRAAQNYVELTQVGVSKSQLGELAKSYGGKIVAQQALEAEAMVKPPGRDEIIVPRDRPQADSEVMALSMDGAMVNIRGEGWKEVKTVAISAVETVVNETTGEPEVRLTRHSYRSGLWEAKDFAKQQWAEGCRRGLERTKKLVSVNDGAIWIWLIVQMCWAPCVEILDWWHLVEKLWEVAAVWFSQDQATTTGWVESQKDNLWQRGGRPVLQAIRQLCPRGQPLPEKVGQVVNYIFTHRRRIHYHQFPQDGYPIGSGTVESAGKLVMQERMKQAGMRWSRDNAQAMLALRSILLSERWDEVWSSLAPSPKLA
jgi:hypothetical protein